MKEVKGYLMYYSFIARLRLYSTTLCVVNATLILGQMLVKK